MIWWQLMTRWGTENLFWLMMTGKIWAWDMPTKFVLHLLRAEQKWHCVFIPSDWLRCLKSDGFFKKYCNWLWNMGAVTLKLNNHDSGKHLHHHDPRKWTEFIGRQMLHLLLFFLKNSRWYCAPWIYTSQGETVNQHFYVQVLRHLCDVLCHEQP